MVSFVNVKIDDLLFLHDKGFRFVDIKSEFESQRLSDGSVNLVLYKSGKLLIQGPKLLVDKISSLLINKDFSPNKKTIPKQEASLSSNEWNSKIHIGSDETLKGDSFGGLVVCAFFYSPSFKDELLNLGVRDSKKISDSQIKSIASSLSKRFEGFFSIKNIFPEEYNNLVENLGSVTKVLNKLHLEVYNSLVSEKNLVSYAQDLKKIVFVVDKFPGCSVGDFKIISGESSSLAIAAASIIARSEALKQMSLLSSNAGFRLPMGSTHVEKALEILSSKGVDLRLFAKLHFRNVKKFL